MTETSNLLALKDNIVYLIQGKRHHKRYDVEDLLCLSKLVWEFCGKEKNSTAIFRQMFLINEQQSQFRIGLCLLNSLTQFLNHIYDEFRTFSKTLDKLKSKMKHFMANVEAKSNSKTFTMEHIYHKISMIVEKYEGISVLQREKRDRLIQEATDNLLENIMPPKQFQQNVSSLNKKQVQITSDVSQQKDSKSTTKARVSSYRNDDFTNDFINTLFQVDPDCINRIKELSCCIEKEIQAIQENMLFHEFKTVSLRYLQIIYSFE